MAVDFSQLPSEASEHLDPPSRLVWVVAFLLMVLMGTFAVLFFWPKDMPTQTWKFWVTLVLFPVGIPTWIVLRRYSVYAGRQLDADLHNEAVQAFNQRVFEAASVPLALIAAAYRFTAKPDANNAASILQGLVALESQPSIAERGDVLKARWLTIPGMPLAPGRREDDLRRQQQVTTWLFDQLLDDLAAGIRALPARVPLVIQLAIANELTHEENQHLWLSGWRARSLRHADIAPPEEGAADFMWLDRWMDDVIQGTNRHATLFVAVQLHPLLVNSPPAGAAEAGVALLWLPDALARPGAMRRVADLHRPVRAAIKQPDDALAHALQWGHVSAQSISQGWLTCLDATQASALRTPAHALGLDPHLTDLDQTVGNAGAAAPWLALACAASTLTAEVAEQIVLVGQGDHVDGAVVKRAHNDPTATALQSTPPPGAGPSPDSSQTTHDQPCEQPHA